jgi:hypothetical protein
MKVHYLQPFAVDKDICKAYNDACEIIPNDDWICITDYDTMFLHPIQKQLVENIARSGKADLYGAMTNRCNVPEFLIQEMFDEFDLKKHYTTALTQYQVYGEQVYHQSGFIPGYFMLFCKNTWIEMGGFRVPKSDPQFTFDQHFSMKVERKGIIKGLYILHLYRIWSKFPQLDIEHLLP